jgi:hypothetical protein
MPELRLSGDAAIVVIGRTSAEKQEAYAAHRRAWGDAHRRWIAERNEYEILWHHIICGMKFNATEE